ncbi:hypothetical protein C4K40_3480 [Pseudomonas sp. CMR5c]|nr:hypothetical protein C4K40_3480 [Pseudomonas sp. CMR5c]
MHTLALALTNRCPLRCEYCCVPPGPGDLDEKIALSLIDQALELKVFSFIGFTGGEPLIRLPLISKLGTKLIGSGIVWGLTTGGGWATSKKKVDDTISSLVASGIGDITVSVDSAHLRSKNKIWMPYFLEQLVSNKIPTTVSCTSNQRQPELPSFVTPSQFLKIEYHYVSPVGFALFSDLSGDNRLDFSNSCCPMKQSLTLSVWPNGDTYPCCSTYVVNKERDLLVGNAYRDTLKTLLRKALNDAYLITIREVGFSGLSLLTADSDIWKQVLKDPLQDSCHLCSRIAKASAVEDLRTKLENILR